MSAKKARPTEVGRAGFLDVGKSSAQLGAGGDGVIHHDQVELFLPVLGVDLSLIHI